MLCCFAPNFSHSAPRGKFEKKYTRQIAKNQNESVFIILEEGASADEKYAAELLEKYLSKILKSSVKISEKTSGNFRDFSIYLEKNRSSPEITPLVDNIDACDEFIFKFKENSVSIKYPDEKYAASTAVGEFLEKYCGVKFFAPSELGLEIPSNTKLSFKLGEQHFYPSYKGRFLGIYQKYAEEYSRLNGECRQFMPSLHNMTRILNEKIIEANPEWMAFREGKRLAFDKSAQADFLNVEMQSFVAKTTKEFFDKNPKAKIFSIEFADSGNFDDTPKSKKTLRGFTPHNYADYGNSIYSFTIYVAKSLERRHPKKFVYQSAYLHSENPPDFPLKKNIFVHFASDTGNYFCEREKQKDSELLKKWASSGIKLLGRYDYNYGSPYFIPRETTRHIAFSIKNSHSIGARSYASESFPVWAYDAHKLWLASKLLKDCSLDEDEVLDEFFKGYYKESAEHAKEFFLSAENAWNSRSDTPGWLGLLKRESQAEILSTETMAKMERSLTHAQNAARGGKVKARLNELRMAFELTKAFVGAYKLKKSLWEFDPSEASEKIIDHIEALKTAEARKKVLLESYERNTKYPKGDFKIWSEINHINRSENLAEIVLNKSPERAPKIAEIFGEKFLQNANVAANSVPKNIFQNSNFEENFNHWSKYAKDTYLGVMRVVGNEEKFVEISSQGFAGLTQSASAKEEKVYACQIGVRGNLQIGDVCYLRLFFTDANGKILSSKYQQLSASNFKDFVPMRILQKAPAGTKYAISSIFVSTPNPAKTLNLRKFELLEYDEKNASSSKKTKP